MTNCYECKFYKKTGFFDNKPTCFGADYEKVHLFSIGEISHINDVGCITFCKKGASP